MQQEGYIYNGERVVRVNKKVARQMYNDGKQIWLIPDMMRLENAWQSPCPISKNDNGGDREFDTRVNEFMYYNCDKERGRGVKYFIRASDFSHPYKFRKPSGNDLVKDSAVSMIYAAIDSFENYTTEEERRLSILAEEAFIDRVCKEHHTNPRALHYYILEKETVTDAEMSVARILSDHI